MTIEEKINAFVALGRHLQSSITNHQSPITKLIEKSCQSNGWFTTENIQFAIHSIAQNLTKENLTQWLSAYQSLITNHQSPITKRIAIVMAGNIPLVGFHDFLSVLLSGNIFVGKLSSQDTYLLPYLADALIQINPSFKKVIFFVERIENIDAVIATGSNNSSRYFEYYFAKYPHLIRKNRNAVAILSGQETREELTLLGKDIFQYFGLGCRNVSKLFIPKGYDFTNLFRALESYSAIFQHNKYANNYNYHKTLYLMNKIPFQDTGFLLFKEEATMTSPVAVLYYEYYATQDELDEKIMADKDKIQCVSFSNHPSLITNHPFNTVSFGNTQSPALWDYADEVDTMKFLLKL